MPNTSMSIGGALFGVAIFLAVLMIGAQCLPEPIGEPWGRFIRSAAFSFMMGIVIMMVIALFTWVSVKWS